MNSGFLEAETLVNRLVAILRGNASLECLRAYEAQQQDQWRGLVGLSGGLKVRSDISAWVARRASKLLPCLPGLGSNLTALADQLKLDWA